VSSALRLLNDDPSGKTLMALPARLSVDSLERPKTQEGIVSNSLPERSRCLSVFSKPIRASSDRDLKINKLQPLCYFHF
jgi:hypothetical protein